MRAEFVGVGQFFMRGGFCPPATEAITDIAFDIGDQGCGDPVDTVQIRPLQTHGKAAGDFGSQFTGVSAEMAPESPIYGVKSWPERQPHHGAGDVAVKLVLLRRCNQGGQNQILVVWVAITAVEIIQHRSGVDEATKNGMPQSQSFKLRLGCVKIKGPLEIRMDLLPESAHEMPALRPGISCLLVARSGRRAPLQFLGK